MGWSSMHDCRDPISPILESRGDNRPCIVRNSRHAVDEPMHLGQHIRVQR